MCFRSMRRKLLSSFKRISGYTRGNKFIDIDNTQDEHAPKSSSPHVNIYIKRRFRVGIDASVDEHDNTLLHIAVREGDEEQVLKLLQWDANVNITNYDKSTALHIAVEYGQPNFIDHLIERGALIEAEKEGGSTPMHMISESPKKIECLECLLRNGAEINARDARGNNLLHLIIKSGSLNVKLLKTLLRKGCDVNNLDCLQENCLHTVAMSSAISNYETSVISEILIAEGIHVNEKNFLGETPLHKAVWGDNPHLIRILLKNGAKLDAPNNKNSNPFDLAVKIMVISYRPISVMIKHVVIMKHRGNIVEEKINQKIQSNSDLISMYRSFERELNSLKLKKIDRFSDCSLYQILCGNQSEIVNFVKNEDTVVVLRNIAVESSKFYWEIVDAWNGLKKEGGSNEMQPEMTKKRVISC